MLQRSTLSIIAPKSLRVQHFGYKLANGVKCIVVQDANAKVPAAAMTIRTGSLKDPVDVAGLAHFCEHMLFMGTEKFPKEGEYDSFITKNGGYSNAFTADDGTTYYFQVSDGALEGALERFVEFFVAPTFDASGVEREVKAVHSEDEKNHSVDYWRQDEILKTLYNPKHPLSRYGNGNITTLWEEPRARGIDIRESLQEFYAEYYTSEAACLVVYSSREPEAILALIEPALLRMKNAPATTFSFLDASETLLAPQHAGTWLNVRTTRKTRSITMRFPVRSAASLWRSMPSAYISHILGHECDSSVLGVLKQKGLATAMVVGPRQMDADFSFFTVTVSLTIRGFSDIDQVIGLVYHGVGQAIAHGVDQPTYEEMKAEDRLGFESLEINKPADHCVNLSSTALDTDVEHALIGQTIICEDDEAAIVAYAKQITPENCVYTLQWGDLPCEVAATAAAEGNDADEKDGEGDEEEEGEEEEVDGLTAEDLLAVLPEFAQVKATQLSRFHRAPFATAVVPEEYVQMWKACLDGPHPRELQLPARNPFLASDLTVYSAPSEKSAEPNMQINSPHGTTFIRQDRNYHKTFTTYIRWEALSPVAYASAKNRLYTRVMRSVVEFALTETRYYGELAALENSIPLDVGGLGLIVAGPTEKLVPFFFSVIEHVLDETTLATTEELFDTYLEESVRKLKSVGSEQPYINISSFVSKAARPQFYTFQDILKVVGDRRGGAGATDGGESGVTYDDYKAFVRQYLSSGIRFECYIAGNMESEARMKEAIVDRIESTLSERHVPVPPAEAIPRFRDSFLLTHAAVPAASGLAPIEVLQLPPFSESDPNVCVNVLICVGEVTPMTQVLCECATKLLSSSFFNALRTREALGYVVSAGMMPMNGVLHMRLLVQSALPDVNAMYLLSRIVAYLSAVEAQLETLCTEDEIQTICKSLIAAREKQPDSVALEAIRMEKDFQHATGADHREKEIAALGQVTAGAVSAFLRDHILNHRTKSEALAFVLHAARCEKQDPLRALSPGTHTLELPPQREESAEAEMAEEDLTLPTYRDGAESLTVRVWDSIASYQSGLPVIRSHTF